MAKILVTGGAGFIGSHTCVELLEAGYEVVIVDNFSNSKPEALNRIKKITGKDFAFYEADLLDLAALEKIFEENKIDAVIHFAGLKAVGESVQKPVEYYHNNITGTLMLIKAMRKYGCKKIVFSSSATVYGPVNKAPYTEDDRGEQTLSRIVEKSVLSVAVAVTAADIDNCLCCYLCILFRLCLCRKVVFIGQINIHILVYKMQDIVFV